MPGCPHAHKVVLVWKLLGLDSVISLGTAGILRTPTGWVFSEDPGEKDPVLQTASVHELYLKTDPAFTGRSTVPFIADVRSGLVANNDHFYIVPDFIPDFHNNFRKLPLLYFLFLQ